jgi:hypothetical protein
MPRSKSQFGKGAEAENMQLLQTCFQDLIAKQEEQSKMYSKFNSSTRLQII